MGKCITLKGVKEVYSKVDVDFTNMKEDIILAVMNNYGFNRKQAELIYELVEDIKLVESKLFEVERLCDYYGEIILVS